MKTYCDTNYYEVGDEVLCTCYSGEPVPAIIVEVLDSKGNAYRAEVVLPAGHPEAIDDSGDPQFTKRFLITRKELDAQK